MRRDFWFSGNYCPLQRSGEPAQDIPSQHSPISDQTEPLLQVTLSHSEIVSILYGFIKLQGPLKYKGPGVNNSCLEYL